MMGLFVVGMFPGRLTVLNRDGHTPYSNPYSGTFVKGGKRPKLMGFRVEIIGP